MAAALLSPAGAAAPAAAAAAPTCAWGTEISSSVVNELYPDASAAYWVLPFPVRDGLAITLSGSYPDSRYASLQVYQPGGGLFTANGVSSAITDYQIQPDPGSVNPWQHRAAPGGSFTITVSQAAAPGEANALPLAPAGTTSGTGYMLYRVYRPARGDFAAVPLPAVTFTLGGVSQQLPACSTVTTSLPEPGSGTGAPVPAAAVTFALNAGIGGGIVANADSAYLVATITPPADGDVVVIRGRAPTTAAGSHPAPWPARGEDMRYYSMCAYVDESPFPVVANVLPGGQTDPGCRDDSQTRLGWDGYYTYVVGTEAQRAAIQRIPGVTFLPFSAAQPTAPESLMLRNMLVSPGFTRAIQDVPAGASPAATATVMGTYYPGAGTCPLATLARRGADACLAAAP